MGRYVPLLSTRNVSRTGRWRTDRNPHAAIMEALADENVSKVIVKSSAQIGKTEIILNTLAYYIMIF